MNAVEFDKDIDENLIKEFEKHMEDTLNDMDYQDNKPTEGNPNGMEDYFDSMSYIKKHYGIFTIRNFGQAIGILASEYFRGVLEVIIYLSEESRGKGLGSQVLGKLEDVVKDNQGHKLVIKTLNDCNVAEYYQKMGFKKRKMTNAFCNQSLFWFYKNLRYTQSK
ncbi:GNAT family N-acetyltransferase [Nanoarchaeota archaeon]